MSGPNTKIAFKVKGQNTKRVLRSKVKVKCRQNLITSRVHRNTFVTRSYQVAAISDL